MPCSRFCKINNVYDFRWVWIPDHLHVRTANETYQTLTHSGLEGFKVTRFATQHLAVVVLNQNIQFQAVTDFDGTSKIFNSCII